jgi:hypothetical protein
MFGGMEDLPLIWKNIEKLMCYTWTRETSFGEKPFAFGFDWLIFPGVEFSDKLLIFLNGKGLGAGGRGSHNKMYLKFEDVLSCDDEFLQGV